MKHRNVPRLWRAQKTRWLGSLAAAALTLGLAAQASATICTTCDTDTPGTPPAPAPTTSPPDAVLQFSPCLPAAAGQFLVDGVRAGVVRALQQLDLKDNGPAANPDVRNQCVTAAGRQTIAIWFAPVGSYGVNDTDAKRTAAIAPINILAAGEEFAVRFSANGISRMVGRAWADVDKRLDLDGNPDPTGTIHLQGYDLAYYDSTWSLPGMKRVRLTVNGYLDSLFADIHFWAWATDTLVLDGATGRIGCTTDTAFDMEDSLEEALANIFADMDTMVANVLDTGAGCRIVRAMPTEVMLPSPPGTPAGAGLKEVFVYQRLVVNSSGITGGGVHSTQLRNPSAAISGPGSLRTEVNEPASGQYRIVTTDMRPPLTVTWSSTNAAPRTGTFVTMTWDLPDGYNNQTFYRMLHATVTDADGVQRGASEQVNIKYVMDPLAPPICDLHPTHYECEDHDP